VELVELGAAAGPDRAMIFCRQELVDLYRRLDFRPIAAPSGQISPPHRDADARGVAPASRGRSVAARPRRCSRAPLL